jgi:hemerythrin-like metal-binding protein
MALIQWDDQLSVKVGEIDDQHRRLVEMINRLHDAMKTGRGRDLLQDILNEMADYVVTHFSTEEKYMAQFKYAGYLSHKTEHQKFMNQITAFHRDFTSGKATVTVDLMNFLKNWLVHHIRETDQKYSACFVEGGLK